MTNRKREQLLDYLIGALEDSEHRRIEAQLERDPSMREELARLDEGLRPLRAARWTFAAPEGLAARTCQWIAMLAPRAGSDGPVTAAAGRSARPLARRMASAHAPAGSTAPWSWADLAVVACICAALALLVFPAVQRSRMNMRRITCQDNMRDLGVSLAQRNDKHPEFLAHLFHPSRSALVESPPSLLSREEIARIEALRYWPRPLPAEQVVPQMSLHPGIDRPVRGQNVLYVDGHVAFVVTGPAVATGDALPMDWPSDRGAAPIIPVIRFGP